MMNYDSVCIVFGLNGRMAPHIQKLYRTPLRDSLTGKNKEDVTDRRFRPEIVPRASEIRRGCDRLLR